VTTEEDRVGIVMVRRNIGTLQVGTYVL